MKDALGAIAIAMSTLLFSDCKNNATSPGSFINLETRFLGGYISADLMPVVPPDPILCQLVLLAKNKSSSASLSGLNIQQAEVFLYSANEQLGTVSFFTDWDGHLGPYEEDTVRLSKVMEQASLFTPPCGEYVFLNLVIRHQSEAARAVKIDSLLFDCVY